MPNTYKYTSPTWKSGKNILASEHVKFIEGGATLLGTTAGTLVVGTAIARVSASGKWVKFVDANVATYDDFGILNIDVVLNGTDDVVVGEVIVVGSVYDAKLDATTATATFKGKVPMIRFVKHI